MNKKIFSTTFFITIVVSLMLVIQPNHMGEVTATTILAFDRICPTDKIYQGDTVGFGGTVFNNDSVAKELLKLEVEVFDNDKNKSEAFYTYTFDDIGYQGFRNVIEPDEAKTLYYEQEIEKELPKKNGYVFRLFIYYQDEGLTQQESVQIGNNATVNIDIRLIESPSYTYIIFVALLVIIIAIIVVAIVGWVRERRNR
jgi:hypothetical protein